MSVGFEFGKKGDGWAGRHHHSEWKLEEIEAQHEHVRKKLDELERAYHQGGIDPLAYQDKREKLLEQLK